MVDAPALTGQILLYRSEDGRTSLDVRLEHGTVWLKQRQLTEPFGKAKGRSATTSSTSSKTASST